jgi:hypothetical protein
VIWIIFSYIRFNNPNFNVLQDDASVQKDEIIFNEKKKKNNKKKDNLIDEDVEKYLDEQIDKVESKSDFLFRRATKHVIIFHQEIKEENEGEFSISFVSNNDHPQIIAVVSDRL